MDLRQLVDNLKAEAKKDMDNLAKSEIPDSPTRASSGDCSKKSRGRSREKKKDKKDKKHRDRSGSSSPNLHGPGRRGKGALRIERGNGEDNILEENKACVIESFVCFGGKECVNMCWKCESLLHCLSTDVGLVCLNCSVFDITCTCHDVW